MLCPNFLLELGEIIVICWIGKWLLLQNQQKYEQSFAKIYAKPVKQLKLKCTHISDKFNQLFVVVVNHFVESRGGQIENWNFQMTLKMKSYSREKKMKGDYNVSSMIHFWGNKMRSLNKLSRLDKISIANILSCFRLATSRSGIAALWGWLTMCLWA